MAKPSKIVEKWRGKLFLNEWYFDVQTMKQDEYETFGVGVGEPLCRVSVDPVYLTAVIQVFPAFFRKSTDVQEQAIVHEMCHCFTQEAWNAMRNLIAGNIVTEREQREIVERLTQRITNAVYYGVIK